MPSGSPPRWQHTRSSNSSGKRSTEFPHAPAIVATGPLTSPGFEPALSEVVGADRLSFFDAAAPVITSESIDRSVVFAASRYGKGEGADYLNAPMNRDEYAAFHAALVAARRVELRDFERRELFAACQPAEEVARTGVDALRFGAMKPVGLVDPRTGERPWAVLQLRAENRARPPTTWWASRPTSPSANRRGFSA